MMTITQKMKSLLDTHSNLCAVNSLDYLAGVRYTPDFSYEYDEKEGKTVFNEPFHELILKIGVVDSSQTPKNRAELGTGYVIDTLTVERLANTVST